MKLVVWLAGAALMTAACSKESSIFPEGYRQLRIGMPVDDAVVAALAAGEHQRVEASINMGDIFWDGANFALPAEPSQALALVRQRVGQAQGKVASNDKASLSAIEATESESMPYESVDLYFEDGKLDSAIFKVRGDGTAMREKLRPQLVSKFGDPTTSEGSPDSHTAIDIWNLCDQGVEYEMNLDRHMSDLNKPHKSWLGPGWLTLKLTHSTSNCSTTPKL